MNYFEKQETGAMYTYNPLEYISDKQKIVQYYLLQVMAN